MAERRGKMHVVRPRWTWIGLALLLAGVVVLGIGVILLSWTWAIVGAVLLAVGTVGVLRGGLYYDTAHGASPGEIVAKVRSGEKHEARGPDSLLGDRRLRQDVAMEARAKELVRTQEAAVPVVEDRVAVGSGLLVLIGAWLALGSIWIYPTSVVGQFGSTRDAFFGVLAVAAGLRLRLGNTGSLVASGLAVVSGLFVLAFGLLVAHSSWSAQAQEIGCGLLILVGAALATKR